MSMNKTCTTDVNVFTAQNCWTLNRINICAASVVSLCFGTESPNEPVEKHPAPISGEEKYQVTVKLSSRDYVRAGKMLIH